MLAFARVVRDFSDRHETDEKLRRSRARMRPTPLQATIAGIVSGEYDHIPEVNEALLDQAGYSRGDMALPKGYVCVQSRLTLQNDSATNTAAIAMRGMSACWAELSL